MFCTKCGYEIKEGAKFCTHCGTPVTKIVPVSEVPSETAAGEAAFSGSEGTFGIEASSTSGDTSGHGVMSPTGAAPGEGEAAGPDASDASAAGHLSSADIPAFFIADFDEEPEDAADSNAGDEDEATDLSADGEDEATDLSNDEDDDATDMAEDAGEDQDAYSAAIGQPAMFEDIDDFGTDAEQDYRRANDEASDGANDADGIEAADVTRRRTATGDRVRADRYQRTSGSGRGPKGRSNANRPTNHQSSYLIPLVIVLAVFVVFGASAGFRVLNGKPAFFWQKDQAADLPDVTEKDETETAGEEETSETETDEALVPETSPVNTGESITLATHEVMTLPANESSKDEAPETVGLAPGNVSLEETKKESTAATKEETTTAKQETTARVETTAQKLTGWVHKNGKYYYYDANGVLQKNKWIDGTYYVDGTGAMLVNTRTPDGYLVGADGRWIQETLPQTTSAVVNNKISVKTDSDGNKSSSSSSGSGSSSDKDYSNLVGTYTSSSGAQIDISSSDGGYIEGYFTASSENSDAEGNFSGQLSGNNSISFTVYGTNYGEDDDTDTTDKITITFSSLKGNSLTAVRSGNSGNDALDDTMGNGKSVKFKS